MAEFAQTALRFCETESPDVTKLPYFTVNKSTHIV